VRGVNMARESRKPTIKELKGLVDQVIENQNTVIEQQNQMLRVCFHEIDKLNMVVIRMLDKQGLLDSKTCPHCDFTVNTPLLEGIDLPTECPACQKELAGDEEE
tara:strand:+ start:283 stop:594 length:312 start_codon:yes stop_codon:yes gene_type:complete